MNLYLLHTDDNECSFIVAFFAQRYLQFCCSHFHSKISGIVFLGQVHQASMHETCGMVAQATGSKVERVVITRLENHTYYSRIVLLLPGGIKRSVDSRPSDSLALALQCEAPLFVARQLAR